MTEPGPLRGLAPTGLEPGESRVFRLHMAASLMAAVASGVLLNNEYIATNGLGASVWQITLLSMIWPVSNFLSVFINHHIERSGARARALALAGLLRLPVALMAFSSSVNLLLVLMGLFSAADSVVSPLVNSILRSRYREGRRGTLFGWAVTVFTAFCIPAAMLVGALLDVDFQYYRLLFAVQAASGIAHAGILALMARGIDHSSGVGSGFGDLFGSLVRTFRRDREFARFEAYFMVYGFAFMMVLPAIPFFARDILGLSYKEYALAKGVIAQAGVLVLSPLLGRSAERVHPFRFTGLVSAGLGLYPLLIGMAVLFPSSGELLFFGAFAAYSVFMAGINLSWNLSSLHFAPHGQEATYQGLHITLTAVRGLTAPLLGNLLFGLLGYLPLFMISAGLFLLSGLLFLRRHEQRRAAGLA
jgi:MFS family permease